MRVELIVALVAGAVALASAVGTVLGTMRNTDRTNANARVVEQLKAESERSKAAEVRRREISDYSEPLARAAYDLQSRLFNTLQRNFMGAFANGSDLRERDYAVNNTVYALGQYLCWPELARREIQFITSGRADKPEGSSHCRTACTASSEPTACRLSCASSQVSRGRSAKS